MGFFYRYNKKISTLNVLRTRLPLPTVHSSRAYPRIHPIYHRQVRKDDMLIDLDKAGFTDQNVI